MNEAKLIISVALNCEARPLIQYYRLQRLKNASRFELFANQDNSINLIVSGIGKIKSAIATIYAYAISGANPHSCFLNLGIAGGKETPIGSLYLIHKLIDEASQQNFYPSQFLSHDLPTASLITFDQVQNHYSMQHLVDMEASGFYQAALQCVAQEHIQIIKIISDHSIETRERINAQYVQALISDKLTVLQTQINALLMLSKQEASIYQVPDYYIACQQRWHFTTYQAHQLKHLLHRWQVLQPDINILERFQIVRSANQLLKSLEEINEAGLTCNKYFECSRVWRESIESV